MLHRIVDGQVRPDHRVWIRFQDGTEGEVDLSDLVGRVCSSLGAIPPSSKVCTSSTTPERLPGPAAWTWRPIDSIDTCVDILPSVGRLRPRSPPIPFEGWARGRPPGRPPLLPPGAIEANPRAARRAARGDTSPRRPRGTEPKRLTTNCGAYQPDGPPAARSAASTRRRATR